VVAKYGVYDEDLFQAGVIGLLQAVEQHEADQIKGRFSAYARVCIISELAKHALASGRRLLPHRQFYQRISIQRHATTVAETLGRDPSIGELIESWPLDSRPPTPAAVERALRPDPVVLTGDSNDRIDGDADDFPAVADTIDVEDVIDAKRAWERLTPAEQARLIRGVERA
jgi:DNA-directed RNA polymerase sigma subunit (sigma70/sigma32)